MTPFSLTTDEPTALLAELEKALASGSIELPPLPSVAVEIAASASDPDASAVSLASLIQRDPSLAGHVMHVANSAAYRPRAPVVSLQQAIAWLGMTEIQQIAFAICLHGEVFSAPGHEAEIDLLWDESLAAGLWAKEIARLKRRNVETAYLSGLLHRVGRAAAIRVLAGLERAGEQPVPAETFAAVTSLAEQLFAAALAAEWHLPEANAHAIAHWSDPFADGEPGPDTLLTHVAHVLAAEMLEEGRNGEPPAIDPAVLAGLNLYPDELQAIRAGGEAIREKLEVL